jgi:hypothetical protein
LENKIIRVDFPEGKYKKVISDGIRQWDIGKKLEIYGLELTEDTQVHFSLQENDGVAKRMLGRWNDGVLIVDIPAFILEGEEQSCYCWNNEYHAFAWIYVTDGDFAETIRKIEMRIQCRPKPDDYSSPGDKDIIEQFREEIGLVVYEYLDENPVELIKVDEELNEESTNPVQNKVVAAKFKDVETTVGNIDVLLGTI